MPFNGVPRILDVGFFSLQISIVQNVPSNLCPVQPRSVLHEPTNIDEILQIITAALDCQRIEELSGKNTNFVVFFFK